MITPERARLVRHTWRQFEPHAADHLRYFYDKLYELDPETRGLFGTVDMDEQRHRLMETIGELVAEIEDPERFVPHLATLGRRHAVYGVRDSDYDAAGVALQWTLERALGPTFTPEVRDAWNEAYHAIASVMRRVTTVITGSHRSG